MYSAAYVTEKINGWVAEGLSKAEIVQKASEICIGWPYVFGAVGELCTPATRKKYYNNYSTRNPAEAEQIKKKCYVLSGKSSCSGCPYYPAGSTVRCFDCRGFTRWMFGKVGITIQGAGATSQWNSTTNWIAKGPISEMPQDAVCCVFMRNGTKMSHTGIHVGGGRIIHCSGTVKAGKTTDRGWTHYAIPKGMEGTTVPTEPTPGTGLPILRKGSKGEYVMLLQTKLIMLGYDLGSYGADGDFGTKTLDAVKKFQRNHGLTVDGIVGPATWAVLDGGVSEPEYYAVRIPHLHKTDAEELAAKYSGATVEKE